MRVKLRKYSKKWIYTLNIKRKKGLMIDSIAVILKAARWGARGGVREGTPGAERGQ